jgi:hypothetical protein
MEFRIGNGDGRLRSRVGREMKGGIFFRVAEIAEHRADIHYFLLPPLLKKGDERDGEEDETDHIDIELPFHRHEFRINPVNQSNEDIGTHLLSPFLHSRLRDPNRGRGAGAKHGTGIAGRGVSRRDGRALITICLYLMSRSTFPPPTSAIFSATAYAGGSVTRCCAHIERSGAYWK